MNVHQKACIAKRLAILEREIKSLEGSIEQHLKSVDIAEQAKDQMLEERRYLKDGIKL